MKISSKIASLTLIAMMTLGLLWLAYSIWTGKNRLPVLGEPGHVAGNFSFINQDGKTITEKDIENKVSLAEYFFTTCPNICPAMNTNLEKIYQEFKSNPGFVILSHTVDPEKDSVNALQSYAKRYGAATPGWQFLTGDKNALYQTAIKDYLLSVADSGSQTTAFIHTQYVALLDKQRQIRGFYDITDKESVQKLASGIRSLLKE